MVRRGRPGRTRLLRSIDVWLRRPWVVPAFVLGLILLSQPFYGTPFSKGLGALALAAVAAAVWRRLAPQERRLVAIVACFHLLVLMADLTFGIVPERDSHNYSVQAWRYSEVLRGDEPSNPDVFTGNNPLSQLASQVFLAPVAVLFTLFGPSLPLARLGLTLFGLLSTLFVYRGLAALYPRPLAYGCALAFGFWPSVTQLQTDLLRDNPVLVSFTYIFYQVVLRFQGRAAPTWSLRAAGASAYAVALRVANVALAPIVLAYLFFQRRHSRRAQVALAAGALVVGITLAASAYLRQYVLHLPALSPEGFRDMRLGYGGGKTEYLTWFMIDSWLDVAIVVVLGWVYFLLVPFPWQTSGDMSWPLIVENLLFYYPLLILGVVGLLAARRYGGMPVRRLAFTILMGVSLLYGVAEANVGTAARHRNQLSWLWFYLVPPALVAIQGFIDRHWPRREAESGTRMWVPGCRF